MVRFNLFYQWFTIFNALFYRNQTGTELWTVNKRKQKPYENTNFSISSFSKVKVNSRVDVLLQALCSKDHPQIIYIQYTYLIIKILKNKFFYGFLKIWKFNNLHPFQQTKKVHVVSLIVPSRTQKPPPFPKGIRQLPINWCTYIPNDDT